ncbi:hypothetical protein GALMADRAFT_148021 [Galerina marginata CBS 339.88]|uniref:Uncharacterized protein n=1 Tax=Galerina marginata (strain CBS 339.88) TaxID=685588 RepID=A0A067S5Z2_GALM3|nr:hypothetical protein GALMADRAFT_148021 [Galerina marginata CBS 339.88]
MSNLPQSPEHIAAQIANITAMIGVVKALGLSAFLKEDFRSDDINIILTRVEGKLSEGEPVNFEFDINGGREELNEAFAFLMQTIDPSLPVAPWANEQIFAKWESQ